MNGPVPRIVAILDYVTVRTGMVLNSTRQRVASALTGLVRNAADRQVSREPMPYWHSLLVGGAQQHEKP